MGSLDMLGMTRTIMESLDMLAMTQTIMGSLDMLAMTQTIMGSLDMLGMTEQSWDISDTLGDALAVRWMSKNKCDDCANGEKTRHMPIQHMPLFFCVYMGLMRTSIP